MIGYATVGTNDIDKALAYFDALFGSIGAKRILEFPQNGFTMYGTSLGRPAVAVTKPHNGEAATVGNGTMVAIVVDERAKVDAFHARALELGATDEGAPGFRGDPKFGYYFAYFRDPDGHKLAVFNIT
ncbi:MAG: VOC family protein, partial [Gammaproteobacteria bacterium]